MYDPQHLLDLQDNSGFGREPNLWLSGEDHSLSPALHPTHSSLYTASANGAACNLDSDLLKDFAEIFPLVQSLIDGKRNPSFTRRGSMIYTKTPSRESLAKKATEAKGRNAAQSIPTKKRRDLGDKGNGKCAASGQDTDSYSLFSSRALPSENDREELIKLREQVEDLQRKLFEKVELLKSVEISKNEMSSIHAELDELKHQAGEKDTLLKSSQLQLSDAKIKLADKQATVEKLQWEVMTSNKKVEKLQEDLDNLQGEISSFMLLFEGLRKNDATIFTEDDDMTSYYTDHVPDVDDLDEIEMQKMEEAREAYLSAVVAAKEKQDGESIAAAAIARLHLQSFAMRSNNINAKTRSP